MENPKRVSKWGKTFKGKEFVKKETDRGTLKTKNVAPYLMGIMKNREKRVLINLGRIGPIGKIRKNKEF